MNTEPLLTSVQEALERLLGQTEAGTAACRELETYRREIVELTEGRGLRSLVIGIVGPKNSGKSWLCRSLLLRAGDRQRIRSGLELRHGTDRLSWIGEEVPQALEPSLEQAVAAGGMVDLGVKYTLLDMPGYDEADAERRLKALRSVTQAPLRVTLFSWDTLDATLDDAFLAEGDGITLLPVVTDAKHPRPGPGLPAEVRKMLERLRRRCPQSRVLDPVLIPQFEFRDDRQAAEQAAAEAVHAALRQAVLNLSDARQAMQHACLQRLCRRLGDRLSPWLTRLREPLRRLDAAGDRLTQEVFAQLVGDPEELERSLRFRLIWQTAENLWFWMVPFRGLLRLLALVGGRVDRLGLAMLGSAPSLARAAFEAVRQVRGQSQRLAVLDHQLRQRVRRLVVEHLQPARQGFDTALGWVLPDAPVAPLCERGAGISITGLDTLRMKSLEVFRKQIAIHAEKRVTRLLALAGMLVFFLLVAGPVAALYQSFFLAWSASFTGFEAAAWRHYPMPSPGFIFINLALTLLPVVGLAGLAGWVSAGRQRRERCAETIGRAHQELICELAEQGGLGIARRDALVEAVRTLLDFVDGRSLAAAGLSQGAATSKEADSRRPSHD